MSFSASHICDDVNDEEGDYDDDDDDVDDDDDDDELKKFSAVRIG